MAAPDVNLLVGGSTGLSIHNPAALLCLEKTVDFSVAANQLAQNEVMALMYIPKGMHILAVDVEVITAEGAVCVADVGLQAAADDSVTDADGFFNDVDLNGTAGTIVSSAAIIPDGTPAFDGHYFVSAAQYLTVQAISAGGIDTGKASFRVFGFIAPE